MPETANRFLAVPSRIRRDHAVTRDAFHTYKHRLIANVRVQLPALSDAVNREQADHSNYESDRECHLSSFLCERTIEVARYSRHPISGIGRTSLRSVAASCSRCRTPEKAASALTTVPGAFVMNVPITNITTINRVSCFQCLERIDEGDMVFGLNIV
jgi:hypothetical protein